MHEDKKWLCMCFALGLSSLGLPGIERKSEKTRCLNTVTVRASLGNLICWKVGVGLQSTSPAKHNCLQRALSWASSIRDAIACASRAIVLVLPADAQVSLCYELLRWLRSLCLGWLGPPQWDILGAWEAGPALAGAGPCTRQHASGFRRKCLGS